MAVDGNTYGTVARVEGRIRDIPNGGSFSSSTTPKLADVEQLLDDVADILNANLRAQGYTVPVAATGDDKEGNGWLAQANSAGAAAMVLYQFPIEGFDPDNPDPLKNRVGGLWGELKLALDMIGARTFPATRTTSRVAQAFSGAQEDSDGNEKLPFFTRNDDQFPGSRTLTTS
jgi:hypothetical protein